MSLKVCMLASGSSGNSILIQSAKTKLLLDAGLSGIEITKRLRICGRDPQKIAAILVSHEHSDHIRGVGVLARKYQLPVYFTQRTYQAAQETIKEIPRRLHFTTNRPFPIGDMVVEAFSVSHDAVDPVGFVITCNGHKLGVATDLGYVTELVKHKLKGCQTLVLESNHDLKMLQDGPYPWYLKQRIRSRQGHLSNGALLKLVQELIHDGLQDIVLSHISETNNHYDLVENDFIKFMKAYQPYSFNLTVAKQHQPIWVGQPALSAL